MFYDEILFHWAFYSEQSTHLFAVLVTIPVRSQNVIPFFQFLINYTAMIIKLQISIAPFLARAVFLRLFCCSQESIFFVSLLKKNFCFPFCFLIQSDFLFPFCLLLQGDFLFLFLSLCSKRLLFPFLSLSSK